MNKLAFTICSVNYLGQAITLGKSIRKTNPDWDFVIGLVDRLEGREEVVENIDLRIIDLSTIGIKDFDGMCRRYNIIELNTAVKPFFGEYLLQQQSEVEYLVYFDPDIMVFSSLDPLVNELKNSNIVLTPHMTCSPNDKLNINEYAILNVGVYNLGFCALRNNEVGIKFLQWWQEKLLYDCVMDKDRSLFVDQKWISFANCYFDKVNVWRHQGCNTAYWNLHDRKISEKNGAFYVNDSVPLIFFHFSGYKPNNPDVVKTFQERISFENRPDIKGPYKIYLDNLIANNYFEYKKQPCHLVTKPVSSVSKRARKKILQLVKKLLRL